MHIMGILLSIAGAILTCIGSCINAVENNNRLQDTVERRMDEIEDEVVASYDKQFNSLR